jgi:hypothetical protein
VWQIQISFYKGSGKYDGYYLVDRLETPPLETLVPAIKIFFSSCPKIFFHKPMQFAPAHIETIFTKPEQSFTTSVQIENAQALRDTRQKLNAILTKELGNTQDL